MMSTPFRRPNTWSLESQGDLVEYSYRTPFVIVLDKPSSTGSAPSHRMPIDPIRISVGPERDWLRSLSSDLHVY